MLTRRRFVQTVGIGAAGAARTVVGEGQDARVGALHERRGAARERHQRVGADVESELKALARGIDVAPG